MNKFQFRPVGQGLFYTGSLMHGTYNFVYDCGSDSSQNYLNNQIELFRNELSRNEKEKPHLDFVLISHLHRDHFSGLYRLLKEFNVDKLYLPYLGRDKQLIKFILAYTIFYGNTSNENGDYLYRFMLSIYGIEQENYINYDFSVEFLYDEGAYSEDLIFHKQFIVSDTKHQYWEFILFNRTISQKSLDDLASAINKLVGGKDIKQYLLHNEENVKLLAERYKEVFETNKNKELTGGLNISSTILIHRPLYKHAETIFFRKLRQNIDYHYFNRYCNCNRVDCRICRSYYCCTDKTLTLLTGDVLFDDKLVKIVKNNMDEVNFLVQIPHHGSYKNWKSLKKLGDVFFNYIVPFGLGNKFKHPHEQTINDIDEDRCFCVTQCDSYIYFID